MFWRFRSCTGAFRDIRVRGDFRAHAFAATFLALSFALPAAAQRDLPENVRHLAQQAREQTLKNNWSDAAATYQKAVALAPRNAILWTELGAVQAKTGRFADAISSYEQALRVLPRSAAAEIGLAQAFRAVGNYEEARRILERDAREHPKDARPLAIMGDLDLEMQTYDAAVQQLTAALTLNPADTDSRNRLAMAYKSKNDPTNALAQLAKVLSRDPDNALAHYLRAGIISDQHQDSRALPDAENAVALQPQNARARVLLSKILLRVSESAPQERAAEECSRAAAMLAPLGDIRPNDSETLFLLSRALHCAGNLEEEKKTLAAFETESQREHSTQENQKQANHLVDEANDRALKNDLPGALDLLNQALEKDPGHPGAYSLLAKLYYSAGDIDKATEAISKAIELAPYGPDALYVQGKVFEKQGKLDEALAAFERTTLVNPKESDAYFEMGAIYEQRNDRVRALAAYKKALELSPGDPDYERALAGLAGNPSPH
jgi:tetratricopeptide (TPR) repeat protein